MARFFNQKVKRGRNSSASTSKTVVMVIVGIILVIFVGVLISVFAKSGGQKSTVIVKDKIVIEINDKDIDQNSFFEQLQNVNDNDIVINYDEIVFDEVGTYNVTITVKNQKYYSKVEVVDTESPDLTTKDYSIKAGGSYKASDFVDGCEDNSGKDCIIDFYSNGVDQDGNRIDYSKFTNEGTYTVEIVASDKAGNETSPKKATLTIGNKSNTNPISCTYGNGEYDSNITLAVNITNNGCAIDLNLYDNEETLAPVNKIKEAEKEKIKKELSKVDLGVKNIYINSDIGTVLNTASKGVVGYTLKMSVSIKKDEVEEVIEEYYLNLDGGREFITNKYLKSDK